MGFINLKIASITIVAILFVLGIILLHLIKCTRSIHSMIKNAEEMLLEEESQLIKFHHILMSLLHETTKIDKNTGLDTCVCCGAIIPEGRHICPTCENRLGKFNGVSN